jgi:oligopeptide/dipeptide ABC transporter ATP-binding protein
MNETLLQISGLKVEFHSDQGVVKALNGINLEIERGRILGLVGETGCGKSVTGNAIVRLIPQPPGNIVDGQILFEGKDLLKASNEEIRKIRGGRISMIFQDPFTSLNPVYTVGSQISEAIRLHQPIREKEILQKAALVLGRVNIPDPSERLKEYPHQFSGGMRQRVMIAMALACNPILLIADEPTTALDVTIQAQILDLLFDLHEKSNLTILLISHDLGIISDMCDDVAVMYAGNIVETAETEMFFDSYRHPYTEGLIKSIPRIGQRKDLLNVIPGSVPNLIDPPAGCQFHPRCCYSTDRCRAEKPVIKEVAPKHKVACFKASGDF